MSNRGVKCNRTPMKLLKYMSVKLCCFTDKLQLLDYMASKAVKILITNWKVPYFEGFGRARVLNCHLSICVEKLKTTY
jgi:hypothetical protein